MAEEVLRLREIVSWQVWVFSLKGGWEINTLGHMARQEARDEREYLVSEEGYPASFVTVRRSFEGPPRRVPAKRLRDEIALDRRD